MMRKILIVDDEQGVLYGMPKAIHKLCDFQGEIKTARNGNEALKEISNCFYDICFLDLHLPDIDSVEIMKKIKEASSETRIVIMTADVISDDLKRTIEENGASLLIEKPIDLNDVKAFIQHTLEGDGCNCRRLKAIRT